MFRPSWLVVRELIGQPSSRSFAVSRFAAYVSEEPRHLRLGHLTMSCCCVVIWSLVMEALPSWPRATVLERLMLSDAGKGR